MFSIREMLMGLLCLTLLVWVFIKKWIHNWRLLPQFPRLQSLHNHKVAQTLHRVLKFYQVWPQFWRGKWHMFLSGSVLGIGNGLKYEPRRQTSLTLQSVDQPQHFNSLLKAIRPMTWAVSNKRSLRTSYELNRAINRFRVHFGRRGCVTHEVKKIRLVWSIH